MATYYIAPAPLGSDLNDGLTPETPFETLQKATDEAQANIDEQNEILILEYCEFGATNITIDEKTLFIGGPGSAGCKVTGTGTFITYTATTNDKHCIFQQIEVVGFSKLIDASRPIPPLTDGDAIIFSSCTALNSQVLLNNCVVYFGACTLDGSEIQNDAYFTMSLQFSSFKNVDFLHNNTGNALNEAFSSVMGCDFEGATGIFLPNKTANETNYFMSGSTFRGAEVTICDVAGYGYTQSYTDGQCVGNNMTRAKVRFTNSPTDTWADIDAIPFSTVFSLGNMQAKADTDLGVGVSTMHSDAFLFDAIKRHELNPRIPNAQGGIPHQINYIRYSTVPKFSRRECKFEIDSKKSILTNGLISSVPSSIGGTTASQPTVADRPQRGYMDTAVFNADTVPDGLVSTWANTNNGGLGGYGWGALSQANDSLRPTKSAGEITFTANKSLSMPEIAAVHNAISIEVYVWIDTLASVTTFKQAFLSYTGSTYIAVTLNPTSSSYYVEYAVGNGAIFVYCTKYYSSLAGFNANLTGRWLHIVGVYNKSKAYLYIDSLLVSTMLYSNEINVPRGVFTIGGSGNDIPWRIRYAKVFKTGLSASQVALAYANRNTYTYELPRQGIGTESGDFLSINTLQSLTLQSLSTFTWVNVNSGISLATNTIYPFISNLSGSYGFEFGIRTATTTASFYLKIGNGTAVDTFYFDALAFASFAAKYFGKWVYLGFSFGPIKRFYVGAVNFAYTTSHISIVTTANNVLLLKGETGTAPTGTLIELAILLERCISQGEVNEKIRVDKDSHSWLR